MEWVKVENRKPKQHVMCDLRYLNGEITSGFWDRKTGFVTIENIDKGKEITIHSITGKKIFEKPLVVTYWRYRPIKKPTPPA